MEGKEEESGEQVVGYNISSWTGIGK